MTCIYISKFSNPDEDDLRKVKHILKLIINNSNWEDCKKMANANKVSLNTEEKVKNHVFKSIHISGNFWKRAAHQNTDVVPPSKHITV